MNSLVSADPLVSSARIPWPGKAFSMRAINSASTAPVGIRDEVDLPFICNIVRLVEFPLQELPCLEGNLHGKSLYDPMITIRMSKSGLPYLIGPLLGREKPPPEAGTFSVAHLANW